MNRFTSGVFLSLGLGLLASCSGEDGFHQGGPDGKVLLELSTDARVLMNTRADDTKVSVVPEAGDFAIAMEKQDGSFSKKFTNVDLFNREEGFPIGTYTLSASFGDAAKEGFELPYFSASDDVTVESGITGHVSLTASLQNSMVSVRYTDDFKSRFSAYSAMAKSETGEAAVAFAQAEERPAYMHPEKIELRLNLTNGKGEQVTIAPYNFIAQPRHHYIVTMGVKEAADSENVQLDVQITEEVEDEFIDIVLGDELFTAPEPSIKTSGFPESMSFEGFSVVTVDDDPRMTVIGYAGLKDVNLSIKKEGEEVKNYQLVNADAQTKSALDAAGLETVGLYERPDQMGIIKFKKFISQLPEGEYTVSVEVVDKRTLVGEPVEFKVNVKAIEMQMAIVGAAEYMVDELTVKVTANQPIDADQLRFEALDAKDNWQSAEVIAIEPSTRARRSTRAEGESEYNVKIHIPAPEQEEVQVRMFYGATAEPKAEFVSNNVIFPEYTVEVDAFAHKALLKVVTKDADKLPLIVDKFKVKLGGTERHIVMIDREAGIFELPGLESSKEISGLEGFLSFDFNPHTAIQAFTTEAETDLANGDFSYITETINIGDIQVGGKYSISPVDYTRKSSIVRSVPNGWANLNELTCWTGSSNKNTWFMVPSTFADDGKVVVQSVGYHHAGTTPATSGGAFNMKYYCENAPSDGQLEKAAGELFLGSYSFDGTAHRNDGITWNTRPATVSFDYSYSSVNNEKGEAYARVLDAAGETIASGRLLLEAGDNQRGEIPLSGYTFGKKAAKIEVGFLSTQSGVSPKVNIPTGSALKESGNSTNKIGANEYHAVALGSKLTIDNVKLGYTDTATKTVRKKGVVKAKRK
ncbi:MAG: DUF4493 domain-containing protein [Muribaculaceae bacterium]|nr:DUF4493 domain-containing protein [Muribaculaceae bacterium]